MHVPKLLLALVGLLLLLTVGAFWWLDSTAAPREQALGPRTAAPAASPSEGSPDSPLLAAPGSATSLAPTPSAAVPAGQRQDASAARDLTVRVAIPSGAPEDAELSVVAVTAELLDERSRDELLEALRAGEISDRDYLRAPVLGGSAQLRLPEQLQGGQLLLDGRFLFLEEPAPIGTGEVAQLAPRLGACLVVHLDVPAGELPEGSLGLAGGDFSGQVRGWEQRSRTTTGALDVEFRALDPRLTWNLQPDVAGLHAYMEMGLEVEPGNVRRLELALTRGATVTGVVVDEQGAPRPGTEVRVNGAAGMWFGAARTPIETNAQGEFELLALAPGELQIEATAEGWVSASSDEFELGEGERLDGMRLVMSRGLSIAGRALLPDGGPAVGAKVVVEATVTGGGWGGWGGSRRREAGSATCDESGGFRIWGLKEGKYTVSASHARAGSAEDEDAGPLARAFEDGVPAGRTDVLLRLAGPIAFTGRVVDDLGGPVSSFELEARAVGGTGVREEQTFTDEEGAFSFARVGPGDWEITASAAGHVSSETTTITLPGAGAELELRLDRHASVAGTVFDSTGAPLAGAVVRGDDGGGGGNPWAGRRGPSAETDDEGRFLLGELGPGALSLTASAESWADSLPLALELVPGELREGAELDLRLGGRIEGTLVSAEGDPESGRRVTWGSNAMGFGSRGEATTDGVGQFAFDHVTPGEWAVSAAPSMSEMGQRMRGRRGQSAFVEVMGDLVTKTVEVADGEVVRVFLGGEPKRPVRVFGAVQRAGEPLAGAQVFAVSEDSAVFEGMKTSTTDVDGSYELVVDRPGGYSLSASLGAIGVEAMIDVPRADELRVDLSIPLGRIEGRVQAPDGSPAVGVRLNLQREDGLGRMRWAGNQVRTDGDGEFAFEDLEAGRYTVRANVASWGGQSEQAWGSLVRGGVEVDDDETTSGVDFDLETAGAVRGLVRGPNGSPAAGVTLFFRDSAGRLVSSVSGTVTDAVGRFEEDGLAPGAYSISARAEGLAANEATSVSVRSSEVAEVELEIEVGTLLIVTLEEEDGAAQRARVEVLDSDGIEVGGLVTLRSLQSAFNQGTSMREQRVGPLPAGRYTVRAIAADGRVEEKRVTVRNREAEKQVRLKLDAQ